MGLLDKLTEKVDEIIYRGANYLLEVMPLVDEQTILLTQRDTRKGIDAVIDEDDGKIPRPKKQKKIHPHPFPQQRFQQFPPVKNCNLSRTARTRVHSRMKEFYF